MYYDAKADAELVGVPTFAVEDREQPEPRLSFWATTVSAVKWVLGIHACLSELNHSVSCLVSLSLSITP